MNEFKLELGSVSKAIWAVTFAAIKFIIVPFLIFLVIGSVLNGFNSSSARHLAQLFMDYRIYILLFGAALTILAGLKGFYPRGSVSRLTFDMAMIPFYVLMVWSFDMGGRMGPAFSDAGFPFRFDLVLWLLTLFIVFKSFYKLAEFIDFRRPFLEWMARTYPGVEWPEPLPAEDPQRHTLLQDFRIRYGRFLPGMAEADRALLKFVIFPLLFIILLGGVIQATQGMLQGLANSMGGNSDGILGLGSATLDRLANLLLYIGLPIAVLSFFKGFYPKGSVSRLTFALVVVALICTWIFFAALEGHVTVSMDVFNTNIHFNLNFEPLLWLFIFAAALWGIYWAVEAFIYRKDWVQNGFRPVDDALLKQQRRERKAKEKEMGR
ncbi:MAG TPA: hypothetical protein VGK23_06135 [Methanomassiliicoccales archaeon]|jgi:hypothetical protein